MSTFVDQNLALIQETVVKGHSRLPMKRWSDEKAEYEYAHLEWHEPNIWWYQVGASEPLVWDLIVRRVKDGWMVD
jgi:hypothetical protein